MLTFIFIYTILNKVSNKYLHTLVCLTIIELIEMYQVLKTAVDIHPMGLVFNVTPSDNNNSYNNEFNARLFWDEDIGGVPSIEFRYSAKMKRYEICRKRLERVHCKCAGWKPRRHCTGSLAEETFYIKRSWVNLGKPIMNLWNKYAEGESSKRQVQQMIKICSPFLIGHNHDEENLAEARIWDSFQERN